MKEYIGNCVGNPFGSLQRLSEGIDNAKSISKKKFLEECNIDMELYGYDKTVPQRLRLFPVQGHNVLHPFMHRIFFQVIK